MYEASPTLFFGAVDVSHFLLSHTLTLEVNGITINNNFRSDSRSRGLFEEEPHSVFAKESVESREKLCDL